jgi:hypothetical protein
LHLREVPDWLASATALPSHVGSIAPARGLGIGSDHGRRSCRCLSSLKLMTARVHWRH